MLYPLFSLFLFLLFSLHAQVEGTASPVTLGVDRLFTKEFESLIRGKRVGLVTNHTAINGHMQSTLDLIKYQAVPVGYQVVALFAPEHGLTGVQHAGEKVDHATNDGIPVYSLHGETRSPTKAMLQHVDLLIYDIQDIGSRSYTYISTLFYVMEAATKQNIPVIVLDRPNPINGLTVDGPPLEEKWKSILGYINIPYCHGMTIGELALYFNSEYAINCSLTVIPMKGWRRTMTFADTHLTWIPTSPHIPEADTAFYYPTTGLLGELQLVNIGVGYTLPFKLVGAPWIDALLLAEQLNEQRFPGVIFHPFYYRPFYGKFVQENCQGVLIVITNPTLYLPVTTQYLILGVLKNLYPKEFEKALASKDRYEMFNKVNGTDQVLKILQEERYVIWKLRDLCSKTRKAFLTKREKYLISNYTVGR